VAITVVGTTQAQAASGTSVSLTKPAGLANGDVIYIWSGKWDDDGGDFACSGFTSLSNKLTTTGDDLRSGILRKVITNVAGEPASYSVTNTATDYRSAHLIALRGVDNTTPEDVTLSHVTGANDATPNAATITTVTDGCMLLIGCLISESLGTFTVVTPSGWAVVGNVGSQVYAFTNFCYRLQTSKGATGAVTFPNTPNDAVSEWHVCTIAVRPAAAEPTYVSASTSGTTLSSVSRQARYYRSLNETGVPAVAAYRLLSGSRMGLSIEVAVPSASRNLHLFRSINVGLTGIADAAVDLLSGVIEVMASALAGVVTSVSDVFMGKRYGWTTGYVTTNASGVYSAAGTVVQGIRTLARNGFNRWLR